MNIFSNLSFRLKLTIPLLIISAIIIALSGVAITGLNSLGNNLKKVSHEYLISINYLIQSDRDLYQAQVAERSFIFVDVKSKQYQGLVKQHNENIEQVKQRIEKFKQLISSDLLKQKASLALKKYTLWKPLTLKVQAERSSNSRSGRSTAIDISFGTADKAFNDLRSIIDELTEAVEKEAELMAQEALGQSKRSMNATIITSLIGIAICLLVSFLLPSSISRIINRITERVKDIASGQGDLTIRIEVKHKDELGILSGTFNQFLDKLQELIIKIVNSSGNVLSAADNLSSNTKENHQNITEQQKATDDVAASITQLTSSVQEVVTNTANAAEVANKAMNSSKKGQSIVAETISEIKDLASQIESTSKVLQTLQEHSENIGSVLDVIKGIAEQTNLLALNAAIEAARAGEQGRGFAVVADEVRTLAVKTQESTAEIEQMIDRLQSGAKNAVKVMSEGQEKGVSAVSIASEAGQSLNDIIEAIEVLNNMNMQIADTAKEQGNVSESIDKSIHQISHIAGITSENSSKNESSSSELNTYATELQRYVKQFKV